ATDAQIAEFWIRTASVSGILIANGFNLLRLAIGYRASGWGKIMRLASPWAVSSAGLAALCYTPLLISHAELQGDALRLEQAAPRAVYGPIPPIYIIAALACYNVALYIRDARRASGVERVELQFVLAGIG